jgi:tetratricopeptide (TPR) repeat protein
LTLPRRLLTEAQLAEAMGDIPRAMQSYDEMLHVDAAPFERATALNNKANLLVGNPEQALELYRQSAALDPIAPMDVTISNMTDVLIQLHRIPEAREMAQKIQGPNGPIYETELLLIDRSWDRADSLVHAIQSDPRLPPLIKRRAHVGEASVLAAHGRLTEADRVLEEVQQAASADQFLGQTAGMWFARDWLARLAERPKPAEPKALKGTSWSRAAAAIRAADSGDSTAARTAVERWRDPKQVDEPSDRALRDHIEARLALRGGHWTAAVEHLRGNARGGVRGLPNLESMLRTRSRWLIADAFEKLGQPDSVATYLQLILEPPAYGNPDVFQRGLWEPFVRSRLVDLYASMGRMPEALREWDALATTCPRPDPDLAARLDETRARLQAARAMRGERDR